MRKLATLGVTLSFVAGLSYAEKFNGRLMDAPCYNTNKVASREAGHKTYDEIVKTCAASAGTTAFAVRITASGHGGDVGDTIKLDASGNAMAAAAMKSGAIRIDGDGDVHVRVNGKLLGETFKTTWIKPNGGSKTNASLAEAK